MTTLIVSNQKMDDIMKIVESLKERGLFIKEVSLKIKKGAKK